MKYHVSAFSAPENDSFARRSATDSRINIRIGTTAAQKWDVSVFVLSPEGQCDWDDFLAVGATAAPHPVSFEFCFQNSFSIFLIFLICSQFFCSKDG